MKSLNFLVISLFFIIKRNEVNAYISAGNCLVSPIISDFNAGKYSGDWYEITRVPALNEQDLKCVKIHYGILNATTLSVHNGGTNIKTNKSAVVEGKHIYINIYIYLKCKYSLIIKDLLLVPMQVDQIL
jgi:lipocalin